MEILYCRQHRHVISVVTYVNYLEEDGNKNGMLMLMGLLAKSKVKFRVKFWDFLRFMWRRLSEFIHNLSKTHF